MRNIVIVAAAGAALASIAGPACAASGPQLWSQAGCGSCHTLEAAGSAGQAGPNLDGLRPSSYTVAAQIASGGGGMPSFSASLSAVDIQTLSTWVSTVAGGGPASASTTSGGLTSAQVKRLQAQLRKLGFFHGPVTGFYGPLTTGAVKRFQHAAGLHADGVWGPLSAFALKRRLG
ncbi:MAG TPA: peptidoglycan-binding protein [Gaiellaceae bacterium]|nr:peptidoglycan-binding protein [Gaiellaceae bacterium]